MLLDEAISDYLFETRKLAKQTHRWYRQKLGVFGAWCHDNNITQMEQVTGRELRRFMDALDSIVNPRRGERITAGTQHGYAQVLKQWLRWCGREDYCAPNLYDKIKLPRVEQRIIKTLGKAEIQALLDASRKEVHPTLVARDLALLTVLFSTGMRAGEACGLDVRDVHLENPDDAYCVLRRTKTKQEREVGLADIAVKYLRRYMRLRDARRDSEAALFINQKGQRMTPSGINQLLYRLRDWAGIEGVQVSAHQTRRAFAVAYMAQDGADVFKLKELLGHSTVQTTMIYLRDFKQRDARRGVNPLDTLVG